MSLTEEYLTKRELASRLKWAPKTVANKMAAGIFKLGVHYFRPPGMSVRFKWSAVVAWMEQAPEREGACDSIPMARGYTLGKPVSEKS
jgi:hypothetical protein